MQGRPVLNVEACEDVLEMSHGRLYNLDCLNCLKCKVWVVLVMVFFRWFGWSELIVSKTNYPLLDLAASRLVKSFLEVESTLYRL